LLSSLTPVPCKIIEKIIKEKLVKFWETNDECNGSGFCYSSPSAWNSLLTELFDITDMEMFKKWLKTFI